MPFSVRLSFLHKSFLTAVIALSAALTLTGCGAGRAAAPGAGLDVAPADDMINGQTFGGFSPIAGAYAYLYQSNNIASGNGYGQAGTIIAHNLNQGNGTGTNGDYVTDANGNFGFTTGKTCTPGTVLYVVISGGISGAAQANAQTLEMAPVELCPASGLTVAATTYVSELTTVASAYALGNFMSVTGSAPPYTVNMSAPTNNNYQPVSGGTVPSGGACTGGATFIATGSNDVSTGTTCTASGLSHAYKNAFSLVNMNQNNLTANAVTPTNTNSSVPQALVNTIADVLQSCVNSTGGTAGIAFSTPTLPTASAGATASITFVNSTATISGTTSISIAGGTAITGSPSGTAAASGGYADAFNAISAFSTAGLVAVGNGTSVTITGPVGTTNTISFAGTSLTGSASSSTPASFSAGNSATAASGASSVLTGFSSTNQGVSGPVTATLGGVAYGPATINSTSPSSFISAFNSNSTFNTATPAVTAVSNAGTIALPSTAAISGFTNASSTLTGSFNVAIDGGTMQAVNFTGANQASIASTINGTSAIVNTLPTFITTAATTPTISVSGVTDISGFTNSSSSYAGGAITYTFTSGTQGNLGALPTGNATTIAAAITSSTASVLPTMQLSAGTSTSNSNAGIYRISGFTNANTSYGYSGSGTIYSFTYRGVAYTIPAANASTIASLTSYINTLGSNTALPYMYVSTPTTPSGTVGSSFTISGFTNPSATSTGTVTGVLSFKYAGSSTATTCSFTAVNQGTFISSEGGTGCLGALGFTLATSGTGAVTVIGPIGASNTFTSVTATPSAATNTVSATAGINSVIINGPSGTSTTSNALTSLTVVQPIFGTNVFVGSVIDGELVVTSPSGTSNTFSQSPTFTATSAANTVYAQSLGAGQLGIFGPSGTGSTVAVSSINITGAGGTIVASSNGSDSVLISGPSGTANTLSMSGTVTTALQPATDGSVCGKLLTYTPDLNGNIPTNTLQAAMNMAKNPYVSATNVTNIFNQLSTQPAFSPTLTAAPHDWTVAVSYLVPLPSNTGNGSTITVTAGYPYMVNLDADDNAYTASEANYDAFSGTIPQISCISSWGPDGTPRYGPAGCNALVVSGTAGNNYQQIVPDALGNLWTVNYNGSGVGTTGYQTLRFTASTGAYVASYTPISGSARLTSDIVDKFNNVDVTQGSNTTANYQIQQLVNSSGTWSFPSTYTLGTTSPVLNASANWLALDTAGNIWAPEYGSGSTARGGSIAVLPAISGQTYNDTTNPIRESVVADGLLTPSSNNSTPYGVAIDANGNGWVSNVGAGTQTSPILITEVTASGSPVSSLAPSTTLRSGGLVAPHDMEVDGANNLWAIDTNGEHEFNLATSAEISPSGGFESCYLGYLGTATTCGQGYSSAGYSKNVAVDAAGDVWYVYEDSTSNATTTQQGRVYEIIGTGFPTWPLQASQQPGFPAGCTKSLASGCN